MGFITTSEFYSGTFGIVKYYTISSMRRGFKPAFLFDFLTPSYDFLVEIGGYGRAFKRKVIKLLNLIGNERLLDVGSGTGALLLEARTLFPKLELSGIDPDPKIVEIAKARLEHQADLRVGFAQELSFDSNSFDCVVSTLAFYHLYTKDKEKAAREIYRVLRKGGKFLIADFGMPKTLFGKLLLHVSKLFEGGENMNAHIEGKIPDILKSAGFKVQVIATPHRGIHFLLAKK